MKGNYGFGEDQVKSNKGFPLSECVDNVELESITYVKDKQKNGTPYEAIDFTFARPDGGRLKDRMFEVNESTIQPRGDMSLEETVKQAYINFNTRLWHIADGFYTDRDELKEACSTVKNFKEFANNYAKVVSEAAAGKTCFVKTVRSKGGYINLPMFPNFIQPADKDCSLSWSDYERKNNEKNKKPAQRVQAADTPAQNSESVGVGYDDDDDDWVDDV